MKIAVHVLAYNVDRYINLMIKNVGPWVDKIYIAYPPRPWDYVQNSRDTRVNPTKLESIELGEWASKVEIIQGDWKKDEDTRNACFDRAKEEGFDWLIIQDADEFYTDESWKRLLEILAEDKDTEVFKTYWYNFWKSSHYVLEDRYGNIKERNEGFAVRCAPHLKFIRARSTNAKKIGIIDEPCYHYGYVKSDEEMYEKVMTWSHAHQFDGPQWFEFKWKHWNIETRNLEPRQPGFWRRAVRFPGHQPAFGHHFYLPVDAERHKPLARRIKELIYDFKKWPRSAVRALKGDTYR